MTNYPVNSTKDKRLIITSKAESLIKKIFQYSTSQKKLWRRVPYLALEADDLRSHVFTSGTTYERAYKNGCWRLKCSEKGMFYYSMYVDLATGRLIHSYYSDDGHDIIPPLEEFSDADPKDVLILSYNLEEINAEKIISSLEEEIKKEYPAHCNVKEIESTKEEYRIFYKIKEVYKR